MKKIIIGFILFILIMTNVLAMEQPETRPFGEHQLLSALLNREMTLNMNLAPKDENNVFLGTESGEPVEVSFRNGLVRIYYINQRYALYFDPQSGKKGWDYWGSAKPF